MINGISFKTVGNRNISENRQVYSKNNLERVPDKDTVSFSGTKKAAEIPSEVKEVLDNTVFEFEKYQGGTFKGTVRDYLKDSVINVRKTDSLPEDMVHCTSTKDSAKQIVSQGLDWTKTGRMYCGPGTYFCGSVGEGEFYGAGNVPVYAKYSGNKEEYPILAPRFYTALTDNKELREKINEKTDGKNTDKILNQYCHDILCNEMGIDILYAATGRAGGSFVVLDDNCVSLSL